MDLSAYTAVGGFERVAVIIGALIIGYWGYRLYGRDKTPGLVFMGIACAVLVLALATGGAYLRSIGTSYQLASAGPQPEAPADESATSQAAASDDSVRAGAAAPEGAGKPLDATIKGTDMELTSGNAPDRVISSANAPSTTETAEAGPSSAETAAAGAPASDDAGEAPLADPQPAAEASTTDDVGLASSQELGGRIISVKSDKVSLEWSRD